MNEKTQKILAGLGLPIGTSLLLYGLNILPVEGFKMAVGVTVALNAAYWGYKKWMYGNLLDQWEQEQSNNAVNRSIGLNEAMQSLKEWSQENYMGSNEIKFQWDLTKFDTTVEKDPQSGDEYLFYAFVTIGENNRMVLAVVEGKGGEIVTHEPIRYQGQERHPFDYSSIVKELRKNKFRTQNDDMMEQFGNWRNVYSGRNQMGGVQRGRALDSQMAGNPQLGQQADYTQIKDESGSESEEE